MSDQARQPLTGVRVVDLSQNLPGPYATFVLASMGATVIKVEPPKGDPARTMEPFFSMINQGKQGIVLDLHSEKDLAVLKELVRGADVFVEGFRPGVTKRLGCDLETVKEWNSKLIYCSISAFGQTGPRSTRPAHDLDLQALSGLCHLERDANEDPRAAVLPVADLSTAITAVAGITAALFQRERFGSPGAGEGQYLDVAMADTVTSWTQLWSRGIDLLGAVDDNLPPAATPMARWLLANLERQKLYSIPHYGLFKTRDRKWMSLGIVDERHFWRNLCTALGLSLAQRIPLAGRAAVGSALRGTIARRMRRKTAEEWEQIFEEHGVPATPVLTSDQAMEDPHLAARLVKEGAVRAPVPGSVHLEGQAPALGEHGEAIRAVLRSEDT